MKAEIELNHNSLIPQLNASENLAQIQPKVGSTAWLFLGVAVCLTFLIFITIDPNPSLLLSTCMALNIGIILLAIYRLFEWELLLSPLAAAVIGPGWLIYYSWGNLGARLVGESRFASNPGSLEFYPITALLSTIGLAIFYIVGFIFFKKQARYYRIRYQDLYWQPWQALVASLIATTILIYLSRKYEFINGYFQGVQGQFDKALSATHYYFVILAVIIGISCIIRQKAWQARIFGLCGIFLPLITALGLRSRTFMITIAITIVVYWVTLRPQHAKRAIFVGFITILLMFTLGTVVKNASVQGQTFSIIENIVVVFSSDIQALASTNTTSAEIDYQYRLAGLEHPAALVSSMSRGTSPMYGAGLFEGMISSLPSIIRPKGEYSERLAIYRHFYGRGLYYGDSVGIPLTSGLADWGLFFGPFIYILIALYCLIFWRLVQRTPSLFLAYLIAGASVGDLFWDDGLYAIRAIGFTWLSILFLYKLVMPKWVPNQDAAAGSHAILGEPVISQTSSR